MVKQVSLFLIKIVQGSDRENGEEKSWLGGLRAKADRVEEGKMVME